MWTEAKTERYRAAVARIKADHKSAGDKHSAGFRSAFDRARDRVRTRVLDEFRQHEWPKYRMLGEIFAKDLGLPVPTLSVCGEGTAEVRFTKLLAHFFDSRNRHGLGGLLARAAFEDLIPGGNSLPFDSCTAQAEVCLGQAPDKSGSLVHNSLDILIEAGGIKILIEQKINSAEGDRQLARYTAGMLEKFGRANVHCFFLTPEGRKGSDEGWTPVSHGHLLSSMASVLDGHALSATARHNLKTLLWDLLLGPLAQDRGWIEELRKITEVVAGDCSKYVELKRWFGRYGLDRDAIRVVAKLIGD